MAFQNDVERKIYFFHARPVDGRANPGWTLNRRAVAARIASLAGSDFYFEEDGGERITCAEVYSEDGPQALKFYAVRRTDLPAKDSGAGHIDDLDLDDSEGLAEPVHVMFFPNNVIAMEAFFYGPRMSRIETFLNERCADELGCPIVIRQLIRHDVIEQALRSEEIRMFRVRLHPGKPTQEAAEKAGLRGVVQTANNFGADVWVELKLKADPEDPKFTDRVKDVLRGWSRGDEDPGQAFQVAEVEARNPDTRRIETHNLLNDRLVRLALIPREGARTRAVDSGAAFVAIREAYKSVKKHIQHDAIED